jgi:hypothetical protein
MLSFVEKLLRDFFHDETTYARGVPPYGKDTRGPCGVKSKVFPSQRLIGEFPIKYVGKDHTDVSRWRK